MSPLNSIFANGRTRVFARAFARAAFALALASAGLAFSASAQAGAHAPSDADARRAEKVLASLRLLHDAADAVDAATYRRLAARFYPGLFVTVAQMREGDLSTDLSTAVFLAEELGRTWSAEGAATADCRFERPDIYAPLCLGLRGGTVRQLLLAKSRLHARWAEALLANAGGGADEGTARALAEMRAARANDRLIAARILETLRSLEGLPRAPKSEAGGADRFAAYADGPDNPDARFAGLLREAGALLAWMPRSRTFYSLSAARLAYADGLWWRGKAQEPRRLVVSADDFQPDTLKEMRLDAGSAASAAEANRKTADRYLHIAGQTLSRQER